MMYDAAIIGTGPAGFSAAVNLKQLGKTFVWFGSASFSDKVQKSEKIANYPGVPFVTGAELNRSFAEQARQMELPITEQMVTTVSKLRTHYVLLAENEMYEARTVLFAIGVNAAKGFSGESELLGKGVSYCATCDGFLYKGKTIAVYCGAKRFEHEVEYLAELAKKVYLYVPFKDCGIDLPNVEHLEKPVCAVRGEKRVCGIALTDGTELAVAGLFCLRSAVAPAILLPGITMDGAHIVVDRGMETSISGCFAAGDCTGRPYQIAKAVGEGNVAAHNIVEYLGNEEDKK